jgi:hypothetical protein
MNEQEYTPNSRRYRDEQRDSVPAEKKKVEKVVQGTVKTKKKSDLAKAFVAEDIRNVGSYIVMDVLIPAAKKALSDIVANGIDMLLYGDSRRRSNSSSGSAHYVSYRDYSNRNNDRFAGDSARTRSGYSYDDVILETRAEANEVLDRMNEIIDTYKQVSVGDLYDLVGITGNYTDNNYGWTDLRSAEPIMARGGGWMIRLPKALPLK